MTATTRAEPIRVHSLSLYVWAIAGCGVVSVVGSPLAGAICDAVVALVLLNAYVLGWQRRGSVALPALALIPLAGLIGFAVPVSGISRVLHDACVAALLLLAVWLTNRVTPLDAHVLHLRRAELRRQVLIAACGIPLGIAGQVVLHPDPLARPGDPVAMALAVLVVALLVAPSLELTFRWLVQERLRELCPGSWPVLVNLLFTSLYLGTRSVPYLMLIGLIGLGLSAAVRASGCVWGAVGAHALLIIGVLIVWPAVL